MGSKNKFGPESIDWLGRAFFSRWKHYSSFISLTAQRGKHDPVFCLPFFLFLLFFFYSFLFVLKLSTHVFPQFNYISQRKSIAFVSALITLSHPKCTIISLNAVRVANILFLSAHPYFIFTHISQSLAYNLLYWFISPISLTVLFVEFIRVSFIQVHPIVNLEMK